MLQVFVFETTSIYIYMFTKTASDAWNICPLRFREPFHLLFKPSKPVYSNL